jgi:hypothetical protein
VEDVAVQVDEAHAARSVYHVAAEDPA